MMRLQAKDFEYKKSMDVYARLEDAKLICDNLKLGKENIVQVAKMIQREETGGDMDRFIQAFKDAFVVTSHAPAALEAIATALGHRS